MFELPTPVLLEVEADIFWGLGERKVYMKYCDVVRKRNCLRRMHDAHLAE